VDHSAQSHSLPHVGEASTTIDLAMNVAKVAWWEMDYPTGNVRFHRRKADMLGYAPERFTHYSHFTALLHPDDLEPVMEAMRGHLDGRLPTYEVDYRIRAATGEYLWFHDVGQIAARDAEGRPSMIAGLVFDISERKQTDAALRMADDRLRHGERFARFGHWELTLADQVIYASEQAAQIYGVTETQLDVAVVKACVLSEYRPGLDAALRALITEGVPYDREFEIRRVSDGESVFVHSKAEYDPAKQIIFGVVQDITARKRAELDRERLIGDLRKALEDIKTLRGIVPICAHCKNIRDDAGYWQQVEAYVTAHTEAQFSHAICPTCLDKFYPGY
jgi:PAS domain S-box-containing protein